MFHNPLWRMLRALGGMFLLLYGVQVGAAVTQLNSTGGTNASNGLHFYLEDTTKLQVRRLNNSGQVYSPTAVPASNSLDNGIFLRANGRLYGPSHTVTTFNPSGGMYNSYSISSASPANPVSSGTAQSATGSFGITSGPQVTVSYRYTPPYDFLIVTVTLVIPSGYAVSTANPVHYYHVVDTYLGGSDNGCGVSYVDGNGHRVIGTYPPPSGTSCPSTTAVPSTVNVVESFRERSGLPFSAYCTSTWSAFYSASDTTGCYLMQTAALSKFVSNTYRDTGVGIEYDFTAAGTYSFSYDFVVGSPQVPAYDHLELQHDGSGTLCPESVTVLGCRSTTLPCPVGSIHDAVLTGTLTPSGGTPSVTWTPTSFSIALGGLQQTVSFQAAAGGTISLGASGLNQIPLNGVQCWNTATGLASCSFLVSGVSCYADALDACSVVAPSRCGASGNRLYTQVAGQAMAVDLVALKNGPPVTVDTGFVSGASNPVTVNLVASSGTAVDSGGCPSTPTTVSGVAAQVIAFSGGRPASSSSFTIPAAQNGTAYRNVWVRFDQGAGHVNCSSDRFSIRPAAYSVIGSVAASADAAGTSTTATPVVRAGAAFDLSADTGVPGYDDLPKLDLSKLEWLNVPSGGRAAPGVGSLSGSFLNPADGITGNAASGSSFTYDEVGYFRFQPYGVYDNSFTGYSGDQSGGDCIGTAPNQFSNTPISGQYGCYFGNTAASPYFGRFVPDHFSLSSAAFVNRKDLSCAASVFTYLGEPMRLDLVLLAENSGSQRTRNYTGSFAPLGGSSQAQWLATSSGLGLTVVSGATTLTPRLTVVPAGTWAGGSGSFGADLTVARSTVPDGPFEALNVSILPTDSDGVTMGKTTVGLSRLRFGRLRLENAYGSELLRLPVSARAEYYGGASGFQPNSDDGCTSLAQSPGVSGLPTGYRWGDFTLSHATGSVAADTVHPVGSAALALVSGQTNLFLTPSGAGNSGSLDLTAAVPAWLQSDWDGDGVYGDDPVARLVFGIYKSGRIDTRERY